MKRADTLKLEKALHKQTKNKRIYGCEEITIGFYNNGHGDEIVDFMTMDSKGVLKCYEIKATLQDLKSSAKKSFYGHYNYLVVSKDLYEQVKDFSPYIPSDIGIIVGENLESKKKCIKRNISKQQENMLKESIVRSMYYKYYKYKTLYNKKKK